MKIYNVGDNIIFKCNGKAVSGIINDINYRRDGTEYIVQMNDGTTTCCIEQQVVENADDLSEEEIVLGSLELY